MTRRKRSFKESVYRTTFAVYFGLVLLFLLLPLLVVIPISFGDDQWLRFPPERFSLRWYESFFSDERFVQATITSLWIAGVVAVVATCLGTITALGISRTRFAGKSALYALIVSPLVVPIIIIALALFIFFNKIGYSGTYASLVVSHVMLALPFPVLIVSASLEQFDTTLERAARVLGANPLLAFRHVILPHIKPAMLSSAVFSFFISFDELAIALFITGRWDTLPKRIWSDLRLEINPTIAAAASLLIILTIVGVAAGEILRRRAARYAATEPRGV